MVPPDVPVGAPQAPVKQPEPSFFERVNNFFKDEEKVAKFIMALEPMKPSFRQGSAPVQWAQSTIKSKQEERKLAQQGNATAKWLRDQGREDLASFVESNPMMAKDVLSGLVSGQKVPDAVLTKKMLAKEAGLTPGTPEWERFMGAEPQYGGLSGQALESVSKVRAELQGLPVTKDFQQSTQAISRIYSSAEKPSAAGDLAMIFNYMKMLDPGSVVRESEFQTASDAVAWLNKSEENGVMVPSIVRQGIQKMQTGEKLLPEQRLDFLSTATRIYEGVESDYQRVVDQYAGFIKPYVGEQDPYSQLVDFRFKNDLYQPPAGMMPGIWNSMTLPERREWLKENGGG